MSTQQHGRIRVPSGADVPSTYRKDQYYAQQRTDQHHHEDLTSNHRRKSHHHHQQQDDFYNHYDELNERVRSPSLPPIGRMKNR